MLLLIFDFQFTFKTFEHVVLLRGTKSQKRFDKEREEKHNLKCLWFDCQNKTIMAHECNLIATFVACLLLPT